MSYTGVPAQPPILTAFWDAAKVRLATARMTTLLGGTGRIYRATDTPPKDETGNGWGRVVLVPARTLWDRSDVPGRHRPTPFLVRAEFRRPWEGFDVERQLEMIQDEAFHRLHGWTPGTLQGLRVRLPVSRESVPTPPEYDSERGLWWMSARFIFTANPPEA